MTQFKPGDRVRVRLTDRDGTVARLTPFGSAEVYVDGKSYPPDCGGHSPGAGTFSLKTLELVKAWPGSRKPVPPKGREFKLKAGDRIVNLRTGREGSVYTIGVPTNLSLWVIELGNGGALASALEEYEAHHPGTYDFVTGPF